jgi:transcriptional regulator with XRE-family HTH domain
MRETELSMSLGKTIRLLRVEKGLTGKALAEMTDVSPSLISKIEHGVANPSYDLLRRIASALRVTLSDLVEPHIERSPRDSNNHRDGQVIVVRPEERKVLHLPNAGLTIEILSPDLQGNFETGWVEMEPGTVGEADFAHQSGEECIFVLEGTMHVYIEGERFIVAKGDCLTFDASLAHRYANEGYERAVWVYIASPPAL